MKRLAKLRWAHRLLSQFVLDRLGEAPESGCLLTGVRRILALQKLDVIQSLVDLLLGQSLYLPHETLAKYVVHELDPDRVKCSVRLTAAS